MAQKSGSKKKRSPGKAGYYLRYKNEGRYAKNRSMDLEKHVDANPNDKQAENRINESGLFEYRRNTHGHTKKTKDPRDKWRLSMYIWNKPYPEKKRITVNVNPIRVGYTLGEQLSGYA